MCRIKIDVAPINLVIRSKQVRPLLFDRLEAQICVKLLMEPECGTN